MYSKLDKRFKQKSYMHVCACMCIPTYACLLYMCVHLCTHSSVHVYCACVCIYVHTHRACVRIYVHTHLCMLTVHLCTSVCILICAYSSGMCVHLCAYPPMHATVHVCLCIAETCNDPPALRGRGSWEQDRATEQPALLSLLQPSCPPICPALSIPHHPVEKQEETPSVMEPHL